MNFITTWRVTFKKASTRLTLIAGALPIAWLTLPSKWQDVIVNWNGGILVLIASGLAVASVIASNIKQGKLQEAMEKAYGNAISRHAEDKAELD